MHTCSVGVLFIAMAVGATEGVLGQTPRTSGANRDRIDVAAPPARIVPQGGVYVAGWKGMLEGADISDAQGLSKSRITRVEDGLHVETGPATIYWNPANTAGGRYKVSATFTERQYRSVADRPAYYGLIIAGNDLGTAEPSYLFCIAAGDGTLRHGVIGLHDSTERRRVLTSSEFDVGHHPSINRAAGRGQEVTQEIAMQVFDREVGCAINGEGMFGAEQAIYLSNHLSRQPNGEFFELGRLRSFDGAYGILVGRNADVVISGPSAQKQTAPSRHGYSPF
jgi:hypothetical protein